jgi:hypothetical protein
MRERHDKDKKNRNRIETEKFTFQETVWKIKLMAKTVEPAPR